MQSTGELGEEREMEKAKERGSATRETDIQTDREGGRGREIEREGERQEWIRGGARKIVWREGERRYRGSSLTKNSPSP